MDEQDGRRHEWAAPEDPTWAAGSPPVQGGWSEPEADGPPPPPWERRRRRRRRLVAVLAVVALVVLVPIGLVWAGFFDRPGADSAAPTTEPTPTEPTPTEPTPTEPGQTPEADAELAPPDPADFTGSDADFATVLAGIEASERTMLRFQDELAGTFELAEGEDLAPFFAAVREVAERHAEQLETARGDLEAPLETASAESVRAVYLDHLDAWLTLMETAAIDPTVFGPTGDTGRFDVEINATAVDFSRTLEAELPNDVAAEIDRYARDLLDRGFRFDGDAQV